MGAGRGSQENFWKEAREAGLGRGRSWTIVLLSQRLVPWGLGAGMAIQNCLIEARLLDSSLVWAAPWRSVTLGEAASFSRGRIQERDELWAIGSPHSWQLKEWMGSPWGRIHGVHHGVLYRCSSCPGILGTLKLRYWHGSGSMLQRPLECLKEASVEPPLSPSSLTWMTRHQCWAHNPTLGSSWERILTR